MRTADAALACCDVPSGRARGRPRRALSHGNEFVLHRMVVRRSDIPSPCEAMRRRRRRGQDQHLYKFPEEWRLRPWESDVAIRFAPWRPRT